MGSFNQRCIITGTPITYGDAVMVGATIPKVKVRGECDEHELQFGIPLVGTYDDYGTAQITNDIQFQFNEHAWETQKFFKQIEFSESYYDRVYLASGAATLQFLEYELSNVASNTSEDFSCGYNRHGMVIANQWIEQIGKALEDFTSLKDESRADCFNRLFKTIESVVGSEKSAAVFYILKKNGLIVNKQEWMIHKNVYDSIVDVFGRKKVFGTKMTYREQLSNTLFDGIDFMMSNKVEFSNIQYWQIESKLNREYMNIKPLTSMWGCDRINILGNYFLNSVSDQDVLDFFDIEQIIDYMVFQNSIYYMHRPLKAFGGLGQDVAWKEWREIQENLIKARARKGGFPSETWI